MKRMFINLSRHLNNLQVVLPKPFATSGISCAAETEHDRKRDHSMSFDPDFSVFTFPHLTKAELLRGCVVLSLCRWNWLVDNSLKLMHFSKKVLTQKMFEKIMYSTFYGQFVGGRTKEEIAYTANRFRDFGIRPIFLFPMEEDTDVDFAPDKLYETNKKNIMDTIDLAAEIEREWPVIQMKMTAILPAKVCEALSHAVPEPTLKPDVVDCIATALQNKSKVNIKELEPNYNFHLNKSIERLSEICKHTLKRQVTIMVDAEYTYLNPAIELLALGMMTLCNKEFPWIFYTLQNCLKRTNETIKRDIDFMEKKGIGYGVKLVRGAYLEKERHLARTKNYPDPTNISYEATSAMYDTSVEYVFKCIQRNPGNVRVIVASHNESSIKKATQIMNDLKIDKINGGVCYGQVFGMSDHLSSLLGQQGYLIYKSIPIGGIEENMAYLSRRAFENRSILERASKERQLMWKAYRMRK